MEPRAPTWRSRLTWMSARAALGVSPGKRTGACVVRQPPGQPQCAVPEAIAETPVTRWIPFPEGKPPGPLPADRRINLVGSPEPDTGSTKVPSQGCYKPLSPSCTGTGQYL